MSRSIAASLARSIEAYADRMKASHPLLDLARRGLLSPTAIGTYLSNARFLVQHTPLHLAAAARRAADLGKHDLSAFFLKKRSEEQGHEAWAESDMAVLEQRFDVEYSKRASAHLRDLIHYLDRLVATHPEQYLAYALFAEYFTVLIGPTWVSALRENCGIPASALSVISKHVALDREHVAEDLRELDQLIGAVSNEVPFQDVLHRAMRHFEAFCDELYFAFRPLSDEGVVAAE